MITVLKSNTLFFHFIEGTKRYWVLKELLLYSNLNILRFVGGVCDLESLLITIVRLFIQPEMYETLKSDENLVTYNENKTEHNVEHFQAPIHILMLSIIVLDNTPN